MSPAPAPDARAPMPVAAWVLGGIAFIPLVGVPFGLAVIVWAAVSDRAKRGLLAALGAAGIASTVALYGALFWFGFVQRGGIYDELRRELSRSNVTSLVREIEYYQARRGHYPPTLSDLAATLPEGSTTFTFDPATMGVDGGASPYYYRRLEGAYHLRGLGPDGEVFTADDILPDVEVGPDDGIGLRLAAPEE